jgi:preprotein translocase subunit SecB
MVHDMHPTRLHHGKEIDPPAIISPTRTDSFCGFKPKRKRIMSEEKKDTAEQAQPAPTFRLQKMYVKDLSFENPNAPNIYLEKGGEPKVDVKLSIKNNKLDAEDHYEVIIAITANITNSQSGKTLFIAEIEHAGVFLLKNIPQEHMAAVQAVECASLIFPFTRQILCQTSIDGGFIPFLMEPVNFLAIYENARKKREAEQAQ